MGCQTKSKELNVQDCQSCHINKLRMNNNNGCCNRGPCTNLRQVKGKKDKQALGTDSMSVKQEEQSHVDNIINDFESKGLEDDLEITKKRVREKGSTPEALKKSSQIARLSMAGGQSKLTAPGKVSLLSK